MYRSKVCVQEFWYTVSGLDIQLEQFELEHDNPVCKKISCRLLNKTTHIQFFLEDQYELMA